MNRKHVRRSLLFSLGLVLTAGQLGCGSEQAETSTEPETVHGVPVVSVERVAVPDYLEAVGTVRAVQTSQLASQLLANIVEIRTREGEHVQRGEVLAVLEDAQPRAALERAAAALAAAGQEVAAAQADYELAAATLRRYQNLYEKKSVSPQEFDEVKARHQGAAARRKQARANLEQARAQRAQAQTLFNYTRIRAPFAGLVTEKRADPGTLATPGMVLLVLENTERFRLEVAVDESDIQVVALRQAVPVVIEALSEEELRGQVVQIVPAADPATRSFLVKVELPGAAGLRSGLFGRALFPRGEREGLLIPASAVVERGQLQGVYVLGPDNVASLRYVTLGKRRGQEVEVLSGLEEGDRVAAAPGERDLAGRRIEAQRP